MSSQQSPATHERFLRAAGVAAVLGVTVSTVWRWAASGLLPQPIRITRKCSVWRLSDVLAMPQLNS